MNKFSILILALVLALLIGVGTASAETASTSATTTTATTTTATTTIATTTTSTSTVSTTTTTVFLSQLGSLLHQMIVLREQIIALMVQNLATVQTNKERISLLQSLLSQDNVIYPEGLVTGNLGNLTKKALIRFINKNFLAVSTSTNVFLRGPARLLIEGAGNSGKIPPGLLTAPGIAKKLGIGSSTATSSATSSNDQGNGLKNKIKNLLKAF